MKKVKSKFFTSQCRYCEEEFLFTKDHPRSPDEFDNENFCSIMCETYHYVGRP